MAKKHDPTPEEQFNRRNIRSTQKQVDEQFKLAIDGLFGGNFTARLDSKGRFNLSQNPYLERKMNRIMERFRLNVETILQTGIAKSYEISQNGFKNLIYTTYDGRSIIDPVKDVLNAQYEGALQAFLNRAVDGLSLSDRVWNLTYQFQRDLEWGVFSGLTEGQSAQEMSRVIRRYLNQPDALFRRVRNSKGKLVLSKNAKKFKPGQGIYRSSYKNAMRVTRTEINTANRTADHDKWKQVDFVLGIEIRLSDSHPRFDMCDGLVGIYPSDFKFTGFHIQCLCFAVPLLPSRDEFDEYQRAVLKGKEKDFVFKSKVKEVPKNAFDWVEGNKERLERWKTLPAFMRDNEGVFTF